MPLLVLMRVLPVPSLIALAALAVLKPDSALAEDPKLVAPTGPRTPEEQQKLFHLPPGFDIQLVAAEPQINKPMNIAFDDRSRLWVTSSVEYPFPAKEGTTPRDSVKILEDSDGDGRADVAKTFVDGLNIPIGVLPITTRLGGAEGKLTSGCIAYSIPNIWRFLDTDGDDRADTREVLYAKFGFQDTHGMASSFTWGFDGWIYATHGFANTSEVRAADGSMAKMNSGNTFRFRADGSRVEQWTWGQVNPFGLAFDPLGNLYSADCHSRPVMMLLRGAYYQSFGKPHDGLGFAPEICTHEHGSTGIAGVVFYSDIQFPSEYGFTIFTGNPVTNRINHDRLELRGSTTIAVHQPDFLSCDDPWFRPVAMTLGPDGALYVADFYNKIIGHYEVPLTHPGRDRERGRIWRIVYTGRGKNRTGANSRTPARDVADARRVPAQSRRDWTTASGVELMDDLGSANHVVRTNAANHLVERIGQDAAGPLRELIRISQKPTQRQHAVWVLERLRQLEDETLAAAFADSTSAVRLHAVRVLADRERLNPEQRGIAWRGLRDPSAFVQRAALDVLGRHPAADNLLPLLELRKNASPHDTQLVHAARMTLRDQVRSENVFASLKLAAFDDQSSQSLADVMPGVPTPAAAEWLLGYVRDHVNDSLDFHRYLAHMARHLPDEREPDLLDIARRATRDDPQRQAAAILVLYEGVQARGSKPSDALTAWAGEVGEALVGSNNVDDAREAIRLARAMKLDRLAEPIRQIAAGEKPLGALRADAVSMLAEIQPERSLPLLSAILGNASEPLALRQHVAAALGQHQRSEVHEELIRHLRTAPDELAVHLAAALAGRNAGAEKLLAECAAGKASLRLLQHPVVNGRLRAARVRDVDERIAKLTEGLPPAEDRLQQAIAARRAGYAKAQPDADRGARVFEKHCANCHTIAGKGAKVGPQLDGIGVRGLDRILEDVLDPNRNVDQAFRSSIVALKSGQLLTGLVLNADGEVLVLADAQGKEVRMPKSDIDEQTVSKISPMPANVTELVPEVEFYDLVAYLLANRDAPPGETKKSEQ